MSEHGRWSADNGDLTLRLNYPLNSESIVFDVGGYKGKWSEQIWEKYKPNIFIFEPIYDFASNIEGNFYGNPKVKVFNCALSNKTGVEIINSNMDGSSFFKNDKNKIEVKIKSLDEFIKENDINFIDLMKINIEGGEYALLDHILDLNIHLIIKNLQIQFHTFIDNAETRRNKIRNRLNQTHKETYCYDFIWENWEKK